MTTSEARLGTIRALLPASLLPAPPNLRCNSRQRSWPFMAGPMPAAARGFVVRSLTLLSIAFVGVGLSCSLGSFASHYWLAGFRVPKTQERKELHTIQAWDAIPPSVKNLMWRPKKIVVYTTDHRVRSPFQICSCKCMTRIEGLERKDLKGNELEKREGGQEV